MNKGNHYRYKLEKVRKELDEMLNFAYVDIAIKSQVMRNDLEIEDLQRNIIDYREQLEETEYELIELRKDLKYQEKLTKIHQVLTFLMAGITFVSLSLYPKFSKAFYKYQKTKEFEINCNEFSEKYLLPLSTFSEDKSYFYCRNEEKSIFIDFSGQEGNLDIVKNCAYKDGYLDQYYFENEWEIYAASRTFSVNEAVGLYYVYNALGNVYIDNTINGFNTVYNTDYENLNQFFKENGFNSVEEWHDYVIYNLDSKNNYVLEKKNKKGGITKL